MVSSDFLCAFAVKNNNLPLAQRVAEIAPFHVMELLARARELEAQGRTIAESKGL